MTYSAVNAIARCSLRCVYTLLWCLLAQCASGQIHARSQRTELAIASLLNGLFRVVSTLGSVRELEMSPRIYFEAAAFSSDGQYVVGLQSDRLVVLNDQLRLLWEVRVSGRNIVNMTPSPGGERIAFLDVDYRTHSENVRVVNADGAEGVLDSFSLTREGEREISVAVSWDPAGRMLLYSNGSELLTVDIKTRQRRQIGRGSDPTWSPDGRWLAYRSPSERLSVLDIKTNVDRFRGIGPKIYSFAHWSPDSKYMFVDQEVAGISRKDQNCLDDTAIVLYRLSDLYKQLIGPLCGVRDWYFGWVTNYERWIRAAVEQAPGPAVRR